MCDSDIHFSFITTRNADIIQSGAVGISLDISPFKRCLRDSELWLINLG